MNNPLSKTKKDDGYAIVEFAVTIPILVSVASLCFWAIGISVNKFQIENYANQAARTIARGETLSDEYLSVAPKGMTLNVQEIDSKVRVETRLVTQIPIINKEIELFSTAESLSEIYVIE